MPPDEEAPTRPSRCAALPLRQFAPALRGGSCMRDVPTSQQLASRVVHLADLSDTMCNELMERLSDAHAWPQRFGAVDRPCTSSRATSASAGATSASASFPSSASRRKRPRRVFRFEHACRLFLRSPRRIVDVAMASGFHDQAHMVREWHALAGCTPREWILDQLPFLQDYELGGGHD